MKTVLKTALLYLLIGISYFSNGQKITIVRNDSTQLSILVVAHTPKELRTNGNLHILFTDIARANFPYFDQKKDGVLASRMTAAGVRVTGAPAQQIPTPIVQQAIQQDQQATIEQLSTSLEKFRAQRQFGKAAQFAGMVGMGAALIWQSSDTKGKDKDGIKSLAILSGVAFTAGFIIDWDAGKHLRLKRQ